MKILRVVALLLAVCSLKSIERSHARVLTPKKHFSRWDQSLDLMVTRCFHLKNVKIECDGEKIDGRINAELQIEAEDGNGKRFHYGYGKSIEGPLCQNHFKRIRMLIRGETQACITGQGENVWSNGETFARFQSLETRVGSVVY